MTAKYIIRMSDGELFGYYEPWLKQPGFVLYDPAIHGYRKEVAHVLGLVEPKQSELPLEAKVAEQPAGTETTLETNSTTELKAAQGDAPGPDLSDVFARP